MQQQRPRCQHLPLSRSLKRTWSSSPHGELTEVRINVQYFAAGERVGAFDSFDEVASGNAQAYHAADYYWKGKHPAWAYFTSVPFGLTHNEQNAWINHMGGQALWDEVASGFGLKCLMSGSTVWLPSMPSP